MLKLASFFQVSLPHPGAPYFGFVFSKFPTMPVNLASKRNFAVFVPSRLKFGFVFSDPVHPPHSHELGLSFQPPLGVPYPSKLASIFQMLPRQVASKRNSPCLMMKLSPRSQTNPAFN